MKTGGDRAGRVVVRQGGPEDAAFAARLHASAIAEGFLASLGPGFLALLYRRVAVTDGAFLLVAEAEAGPVGFIAGARSLGALYRRFLLADGVRVAVRHGPRLLAALPRVLETWRQGAGADGPGVAGTELLAVAVDPAHTGAGVGRRLVDAFVVEAAALGRPDTRVVVGAGNEPAIALYRRAGFRPAAEVEVHRGVPSLVMARPAGGGDPCP